ncbi:MAG: tetratricopeptide repeat protein [Bradymonadales bacterium]|nr:tetratricopeptide repeat protein [Bradymonadales bacterium]
MSVSTARNRNNQLELEDLHREIVEARNLAIKTDNLVKNLSAEIKQVARYQQAHQRKSLLNSAVAYALFVVVVFAGLYLSFNTKVRSDRREIEHYQARTTALETNLAELQAELDRRREAENRAYSFYQLLESGDRDEVVEQFEELRSLLVDQTMIQLLQDRVEEINYALAEQSYRDGMAMIREERWADARDAFLKSTNHLLRTPWCAALHFNLALALFELEDYEGALAYFDQALSYQELDPAYQAEARFRRALCLESTGRLAEALEAYTAFRRNHPTHRFASRALHGINRIQRELERNPPE